MRQREEIIALWFRMWLENRDLGMEHIFEPDCVYTESWGPEYKGLDNVRHWFAERNSRGRVIRWDIKQFLHSETQTAAEWHFEDQMLDGRAERFDGVSLITWSGKGKIARLKEFGCKIPHYNPYAHGDTPVFENTEMWI